MGLTFLVGVCIALAGVTAVMAVPSSFVRHENRYWTWYAPKRWVAAWGRAGIDITSPTGTKIAGDAFSPWPCPSNVERFFAQQRSRLKRSGGLYPKPLRSARYTSVGSIRNLGGGLQKQHSTYRGTRPSGAGIRGELDLIFSRFSSGCGIEGQIRAAPARSYRGSIGTLRQIQKALRYHPN